MNYTTESLRTNYWNRKDSVQAIDDSALTDPDMGWTEEEIAELKGKQ